MIEQSTVIAASLAGKRIAITGSTGFVGTALVERLLRSVPECELVLLVRDGKRTPAAKRTQKEILKNDAFDRLRAEHGDDFDTNVAGRVTTIAGDVTVDGLGLSPADREIFRSCDTVIHSAAAVSFDMRFDQPNNRVALDAGVAHHLGALEVDADGVAVARWYTDLKRHDMGERLSDPSDPLGIGAAMFLTRSLAGVGSTGPWLHDGRATTLDEAILAHGGEGAESRDAYGALSDDEKAEIVSFLENLVIFKADSDH